MDKYRTTVLIIGGGVTGVGVARDLALRGVKCLLVERRDINAGASGGNHGLLHSGARYVESDAETARECQDEAEVLKTIAPHCIDDTGGLFVAVQGDDEQFIADFPALCSKCHIPIQAIDVKDARSLEPMLSPQTIAAYAVNDASIDPFMLSLDNLAQALSLGTLYKRNATVRSFHIKNGRIQRTTLYDAVADTTFEVEAEIVVNATGAWADEVARLAGASVPMLYSSGSMLITQDRIAYRVINRLRKASDADILVPGGTVSVLGTTSVTIDSPDDCRPTVSEVNSIIDDAKAMIPVLETTRYIRAYAGVRPLVLSDEQQGARNVSRGFLLQDHTKDTLTNFITITGGKLTTYRLMAEKTADMICAKLGNKEPCQTATTPLPASGLGRWTEPGHGAISWLDHREPDDTILCECEMISRNSIDSIIQNLEHMRGDSMLNTIGQRSRVAKGPCQGGFCGLRITSHLYDQGHVRDTKGIHELLVFIQRKWRGLLPVLWGTTHMQAELQEAMYCGGLDLDLVEAVKQGKAENKT